MTGEPGPGPCPGLDVGSVPLESEPEHPHGSKSRRPRLNSLLGAEKLGATLYELAPGERVSGYHFEHGNEEWLLVLEGRPTVRDPDGEHVLEPADLVWFPCGPQGAHEIGNASESPARVLVFTTTNEPSLTSYSEHGTVRVTPPGKLFRKVYEPNAPPSATAARRS